MTGTKGEAIGGWGIYSSTSTPGGVRVRVRVRGGNGDGMGSGEGTGMGWRLRESEGSPAGGHVETTPVVGSQSPQSRHCKKGNKQFLIKEVIVRRGIC